MPKYSFKIAKDVMSDIDKNRIVATYLSMDNPNAVTDWTLASDEFGSASVESMKVMVRSALKKIKDAGGELDASHKPIAADSSSPASAKKNSRKRKTEDGDDDISTITKAKKGRPAKKALSKSRVKAEDDDEDGIVSPGADDDLDNIKVNTDSD